MCQQAKSKMTFLAIIVVFQSICIGQGTRVPPVKSLELGNAFLYWTYGQIHGGFTWNYNYTVTVLTDTLVNGKLFHCLSDGSIEFSDSTRLVKLSAGSEQVICDFHWAIGDTINIDNLQCVVYEKGITSIFSQVQPYMALTYRKLLEIGTSGTVRFIKTFGLTYDSYSSFTSSSTLHLLGARLNGVVYGSPPTSITRNEEVSSEIFTAIFPNPTSHMLNIRVRVPQVSDMKIELFNLLGQVMGSFYESNVTSGDRAIAWSSLDDAGGHTLTSGVYFVRIQIASRVFTHRILVLR